MRKPHEILRLAINSDRYNPSTPWLCNILGNLYRDDLIEAEEWEAALEAVHDLSVSIWPEAERGDPLINSLHYAGVNTAVSDRERFWLCKAEYEKYIKRLEARDA